MGYRQLVFPALAGLLLACGSPATNKSYTPTGGSVAAQERSKEDESAVEAEQVAAISDAVNTLAPGVYSCWARGAADDLHLSGRVVLGAEVASDGSGQVSIVEESVRDDVLTSCLTQLWTHYRWPSIFVGGERIVLPPFEFVAPASQYTVTLAHVPAQERSGGRLLTQPLLTKANTGNGQAVMSVLTMRDGLRFEIHTHESAELLFILSGGGRIFGVGADQELEPGSAVLVAAGVVHGLVQEGSDPLELVQFFSPVSPGSTVRTPFLATVPVSGPRPLLRRARDSEALSILDGLAEVKILIDEPQSGDSSAYVGALTAQVGAVDPPHRHENSSEYLFVFEGLARFTIGGRELLVQAGDAVQVPPNVLHGSTILGGTPFKALQFYAPAGPEQRFKAMAAATHGARR